MFLTRLTYLLLICLFITPTLVSAQDEPEVLPNQDAATVAPDDTQSDDAQGPLGPWEISFRTGAFYSFDSDIDNGGEFSLFRANAIAGVRYNVRPGFFIDAGVGYEFDGYNFSGSTGFGGSNPWGDIHSARFRANATFFFTENWGVFGGPVVTWSGENGADFDGGFTYGGLFGGAYRLNEDFSIAVGMGVFTQLEDTPAFFPVIVFNWHITDAWTLRSGNFDLGSSGGAGIELGYEFFEEFEVAIGAQYQTRRFRLDGQGVAPDGVGQDRVVPLYARFTYKPDWHADVKASLVAGATVFGELQLVNGQGNKIAEQDYDPSPFIGLSVSLDF